MSTSFRGRSGIAILANVLCSIAIESAARAKSAELMPIDPFCHYGSSECVQVEIDPGFYLPEREPPNPWTAAIEVGYTESPSFVCSFSPAPDAPGCIDINELTAITPKIELPGNRR